MHGNQSAANDQGPADSDSVSAAPYRTESAFALARRMVTGAGLSAVLCSVAQATGDPAQDALRDKLRNSLMEAARQPARDLAELLGHMPDDVRVRLVAHSHGGVVLNRLFDEAVWPSLRGKVVEILAFGCPVVVLEATAQ